MPSYHKRIAEVQSYIELRHEVKNFDFVISGPLKDIDDYLDEKIPANTHGQFWHTIHGVCTTYKFNKQLVDKKFFHQVIVPGMAKFNTWYIGDDAGYHWVILV